MPKVRAKGLSDPYMDFLTSRQYGIQKHGLQDRLYKSMADDLLRSPPMWVHIYLITWSWVYIYNI